MSRLLLLNALLLGGIAMATLRLMELNEETARREQMVHDAAPLLPKAKGTAAVPAPERTTAANYLDIAARLLFSKDRNPAVIITPPPVKPVPQFPLAYGVLMIANPPVIMMAAKKGDRQKGYRAGDPIGDFKIVGFDSRTITLEWDGQKFTKSFQELVDRDAQSAALLNRQNVPETPAPAAAPAAATQVLSNANSASTSGPGMDTGGGIRACQPNDSAPAGAVVDGYRKVVSETPFGKVCRWEKVK
ncbi:MAG TPA: hypothetical protein VFQ91_05935 [Bryobacteraceae bacterium]|nr:hypothetical protein [Bryobacteraceae bacterium]